MSQAANNLTKTRNTTNRARLSKTGRAGRLTRNERVVCERGVPHGTAARGFGIRDVDLPGQRGRPGNGTPSHPSPAPEFLGCASTCWHGKPSGAPGARGFRRRYLHLDSLQQQVQLYCTRQVPMHSLLLVFRLPSDQVKIDPDTH